MNTESENPSESGPFDLGKYHFVPSHFPRAKGEIKVEVAINIVHPAYKKLLPRQTIRFAPTLKIDATVFGFHALRRDLSGFMTQEEIRAVIKYTIENYVRRKRLRQNSVVRDQPIEDIVFNLHALRPDFSGFMTQAEIHAAIKEAVDLDRHNEHARALATEGKFRDVVLKQDINRHVMSLEKLQAVIDEAVLAANHSKCAPRSWALPRELRADREVPKGAKHLREALNIEFDQMPPHQPSHKCLVESGLQALLRLTFSTSTNKKRGKRTKDDRDAK